MAVADALQPHLLELLFLNPLLLLGIILPPLTHAALSLPESFFWQFQLEAAPNFVFSISHSFRKVFVQGGIITPFWR